MFNTSGGIYSIPKESKYIAFTEKMIFQKKSHWNMIYLVFLRNITFLFPENMILFFRQKMEDDLSQKNAWKCDIFFKCSEKMVFPKKNTVERWYFLPANMIFFLWTKNERWSFSRNVL